MWAPIVAQNGESRANSRKTAILRIGLPLFRRRVALVCISSALVTNAFPNNLRSFSYFGRRSRSDKVIFVIISDYYLFYIRYFNKHAHRLALSKRARRLL